MKKILPLVFLFFNITCLYSQSQKIVQKDYEFEIPATWCVLPPESISELQAKNTPDLRTYIIGYRADSLNPNADYIILNYNEIPGIENDTFINIVNFQKSILEKQDIKTTMIIDSAGYKFYTQLQMVNNNVTMGYCVGGNGILYIQYYSINPEHTDNEFKNIYQSVKLISKFPNKNQYDEIAERHLKKSGNYAMYGGIFFVLLILVYWYKRRTSKQSN